MRRPGLWNTMCGLSGTEFIVVLLVAIIVLGPEKLPELLKWAGRTMKEVRRLTGDLGQVSREIQQTTDVDALRKQLREELQLERVRQVRTDVEDEIDAIRSRTGVSARRARGRGAASADGAALADSSSSTAAVDAARPAGATVQDAESPAEQEAAPDDRAAVEADSSDLPPLPPLWPAQGARPREDLGGPVHAPARSAVPREES